jgi:REP element-mobilizing transposase RayT
MEPLYTPSNCSPAYELCWSLALFATANIPPATCWIEPLRQAVEPDGVRVLDHACREANVWLLLLSTRPGVAPPAIVKSVKGRLQHLLCESHPQAFRRNFSLTSVGEARRTVVEAYVASQFEHHRMAEPQVQERLAPFQLSFSDVDLSQPQFSSHGRYLYNLHLVLVHDQRWREVREDRLALTRDMIVRVAAKKQHRLSRAGILPDHLHLAFGCHYQQSPEDAALSYLNNLAFAHGMKPVFQYGYFVGTFGEYDLDAVRRNVWPLNRRSTDAGSVVAEVVLSFPRSSFSIIAPPIWSRWRRKFRER